MKDEKEYITVCKKCGTEVSEVTYNLTDDSWDGNTICNGCGEIDPETEEITIEEYDKR